MISQPSVGVSDTLWVEVGGSSLVSPSFKRLRVKKLPHFNWITCLFSLSKSSLTPPLSVFHRGKVKTLNRNLEGFVNNKHNAHRAGLKPVSWDWHPLSPGEVLQTVIHS